MKLFSKEKNAKRSRCLLFGLISVLFFTGCERFQFQKVKHPVYPIEFEYPKTWTLERDTKLGSAFSLVLEVKGRVFHPNLNILIEKSENQPNEVRLEMAKKQLSFLFGNLRVLAEAKRKVSGLEASVLRCEYRGEEGMRILQQIFFQSQDLDYTVSYSFSAEKETKIEETISRIIDSIKVTET